MDLKTKTPQYIKGYWRNADGTKAPEPQPVTVEKQEPQENGLVTFYSVAGFMLIPVALYFWQYVLALTIAGTAITIAVKRHRDPSRLIINY